jgi:hypothetical protein
VPFVRQVAAAGGEDGIRCKSDDSRVVGFVVRDLTGAESGSGVEEFAPEDFLDFLDMAKGGKPWQMEMCNAHSLR